MWDELRLWGAVPKAMHELGTLQLGEDSPIFTIMQSYPPGLSLLGFYFTAFSKEFAEGALFVGYACGTMAFLIPALSRWQWKDRPILPLGAILLFAAPFVFTSHYQDHSLFGMTLFVDPILGNVAGSAFYYASQDPFKDRFSVMRFCLILMLLSLLKGTGILFAVFALICAIVLSGKKCSFSCVLPLVALVLSFGLWKLLLSQNDVHDLVPLRLHLLSGMELSNLLTALVSVNVICYGVPLGPLLSFAAVYSMLWILYAVSARHLHRSRQQQEQADADALKIRQAVLQDPFFRESSNIYLVMAGDGMINSRCHHRIFFDLISKEMTIRNVPFQTQVVSPDRSDPAGEWQQELINGFDYVYVLSVEKAFIPVFLEFSDVPPEANTLYRVAPSEDGTLRLIPSGK